MKVEGESQAAAETDRGRGSVFAWVVPLLMAYVEEQSRGTTPAPSSTDRLARYGRLINDRLAAHVLRTKPAVRFLMGVADARPLHPQQRAEFSMALALRLARSV